METKVLVNKNLFGQNALISTVRDEINLVNETLIPALVEFGEEITDKVLSDCLKQKGAALKKRFFNEVEKDAEKFSSRPAKMDLRANAKKCFDEFIDVVNEVYPKVKYSDYLSIIDGQCVLTEEKEAELRETAYVYLTNPEEIKAFYLIENAVNALNDLFMGDIPLDWASIFVLGEDNLFSRNDEIRYERLVRSGHKDLSNNEKKEEVK